MFHANPRIGFLAHARELALSSAATPGLSQLVFNDRLDAAVTGVLVCMVALILIESGLIWMNVVSGRKQVIVRETPFIATRFAAEEQG